MSDLSTRFLKLQTRSTFCKELHPSGNFEKNGLENRCQTFLCALWKPPFEPCIQTEERRSTWLKSRHKGRKSYLIKWFLSESKRGSRRERLMWAKLWDVIRTPSKTFLAWPLPVVSQHAINLLPELIFPAWFPTLQLSRESLSSCAAWPTHGLVQ